jgi:hypothetical protein
VRYVATGISAGASAISYSLTTDGLDSIVDLLVPVSGPPHAMITYNCLNPSREGALGGSGEHIIDGSYGFFGGTGPCYLHNSAWTQTWNADSVETGGISYFWPNTKVHFIVGERDSKGIRDDATALLNVLIKNGTAATYQLVPTMPHQMQKVPDGLNALSAALTGMPTR